MGRVSIDDYQKMLDAAGDDAEREAEESQEQAAIDERLAALADDGQDIGEAERAAASANGPTTRADGKPLGIAGYKSRPLTPAQIAFAQGIIEGKSRRQAYRDAYPNAKGADTSISASAGRLAKDPRIQKMINDAWDETQESLADDVQAQRRYVSRSLVALSKAGKTESTRLRALELLGRASGMFKDTAEAKQQAVTPEQLRRELASHLRLLGVVRKTA
jgi:hypothetical protein